MRIVSYTRSTSCKIGDWCPADIIKQQNDHIRAYAKSHGFKIEKTYSDRKWDEKEESSFRQLLEDGMRRQFDAVIVDSVYRAGASLWKAREVLLETFCLAGIGFIVVEDNFNSMEKSKEEAEKYFIQKGYEQRCHIAHEVRMDNAEQGILNRCDVKYGFKLSERQDLIIDEETAPVVRHIFELCASGKTLKETAEILRSEKILKPRPTRETTKKDGDPYKWSQTTIQNMIQSTVYIGYFSKTVRGQVIKYSNQPIVSEELFQKAQQAIQALRKRSSPAPEHAFSGLIVESRCGEYLHYHVSKRSGLRYFRYNSKNRLNPECENTYISYDKIESSVRSALKSEKELTAKALEYIRREGQAEIEARLQPIRETARQYSFQLADMQKNRILDEHLINESENFWKEVKKSRVYLKKAFSEKNPWIQLFQTWDEDAEMENKLLKKYILKVYVEDLERVTVAVKEEKWKLALPDLWR